MDDFDYSNLEYIEKIQGNYILLKNGGTMHCINLDIRTQEDLELEDAEIGKMIKTIERNKKIK